MLQLAEPWWRSVKKHCTFSALRLMGIHGFRSVCDRQLFEKLRCCQKDAV